MLAHVAGAVNRMRRRSDRLRGKAEARRLSREKGRGRPAGLTDQINVPAISRKAWTISGSNCVPAYFVISATAVSWLKALR